MNLFSPSVAAVRCLLIVSAALCSSVPLRAGDLPARLSPVALPGGGLSAHDFVYAGEWDTRKPDAQSLFVVRGGRVVWSISMPIKTAQGGVQEFDDATMLPDGNLLFARMSGAGLVTPDKRILWHYEAPPGAEVHSIQPIGKNLVLIARNGPAPAALVIDTATGRTVREIPVATTTAGAHGQFRHIRMTAKRTIVVPLLGEGRVVELDLDGRELWSVRAKSPWSAERLKNGHTLIAGDWSGYVREVDPAGATVWEFTHADVPDIKLYNLQTAQRLANGNTVICSWVAGNHDTNQWPETVQAIEVTPEKKVVWALRSWTGENDLGPATHLHLLDQPTESETVDFAL